MEKKTKLAAGKVGLVLVLIGTFAKVFAEVSGHTGGISAVLNGQSIGLVLIEPVGLLLCVAGGIVSLFGIIRQEASGCGAFGFFLALAVGAFQIYKIYSHQQ